ncbi:MAG: Gfo/Idh/MocA family protein [Candidatus Helarchaeota archaeon]
MAKKLIDVAEKMKKILIVGHILRFSKPFDIVSSLISKNKIGEVTMINCRRFISKNIKNWWRDLDRFLLLYEGIHIVDILINILREIPCCINCRLNYLHPDIKGESEFMAILEFEPGITAVVHHNMMSSYNTNEIYFSGTNGELLIKDFSNVYLNGSLIYESSFNEMMENSSFNEMKVFLDTLIYGEFPKSSAKEILPLMKVIEACYLSAHNKKVINMEEV